ncbi:MAG: hypothetical protein ACYDAG_15625 [Chloroflexota bacterium]
MATTPLTAEAGDAIPASINMDGIYAQCKREFLSDVRSQRNSKDVGSVRACANMLVHLNMCLTAMGDLVVNKNAVPGLAPVREFAARLDDFRATLNAAAVALAARRDALIDESDVPALSDANGGR